MACELRCVRNLPPVRQPPGTPSIVMPAALYDCPRRVWVRRMSRVGMKGNRGQWWRLSYVLQKYNLKLWKETRILEMVPRRSGLSGQGRLQEPDDDLQATRSVRGRQDETQSRKEISNLTGTSHSLGLSHHDIPMYLLGLGARRSVNGYRKTRQSTDIGARNCAENI